TLTGLDAGTRYRYTVRARDPSGNVSSMSNAVEVTTPTGDHTPPTAPSHVQAAGIFSRSVELRWTPSADPDDEVASYDVYLGHSLASTVPAGSETCPLACAIVRALEPETRYGFTIRARDGAGNVSPASRTVTVVTPPPGTWPIVD